MKITSDSLLGLKRHFVGTLNAPSPVWLRTAEGPQIGFSGEGVWEGASGCMVDFGTVEGVSEYRRMVRVENLGREILSLSNGPPPSWLQVRWLFGGTPLRLDRGGTADLEMLFRSESAVAQLWTSSLELRAEAESGIELRLDIKVRAATRLSRAYGLWNFNGLARAASHDFGLLDPLTNVPQVPSIYGLAVENLGTAPLEVRLSDLPGWLVVVSDRAVLRGPAPGQFFTGRAPFRLCFEPVPSFDLLGVHEAEIALSSNDERPEFQALTLLFAIQIEATGPHVTADKPAPLRGVPPQPCPFEIPLWNWGGTAAHLRLEAKSFLLEVGELPVVPPAREGAPGSAVLRGCANLEGLPNGQHYLALCLRIDHVTSDSLFLPIVVDVVAAESMPSTCVPALPLPKRVAAADRAWRYLALACLALALLVLVVFLFR